jgi:hypothetical protein
LNPKGLFTARPHVHEVENENAAPAGDRNGESSKRFANRQGLQTDHNRTPLTLTSVRFAPLFSDEGYLFGWEVAR